MVAEVFGDEERSRGGGLEMRPRMEFRYSFCMAQQRPKKKTRQNKTKKLEKETRRVPRYLRPEIAIQTPMEMRQVVIQTSKQIHWYMLHCKIRSRQIPLSAYI